MRYYKQVSDGYILAIGTGLGGIGITETEYNDILSALQKKPASNDKYDYRLRDNLFWEEYELQERTAENE